MLTMLSNPAIKIVEPPKMLLTCPEEIMTLAIAALGCPNNSQRKVQLDVALPEQYDGNDRVELA